jgi:hypothetical protein
MRLSCVSRATELNGDFKDELGMDVFEVVSTEETPADTKSEPCGTGDSKRVERVMGDNSPRARSSLLPIG